MHRALARLDHRPWPVPSGPWVLRQRWRNLLFAHWPVATARLRHLVPAGLAIEEFGGTSWVGIVPFRIEGLTWRFLCACWRSCSAKLATSTCGSSSRWKLHAFFERERRFFLTGGAALAGYHLAHRLTDDLDLFTHEKDAFDVGGYTLVAVADAVGASLAIRQEAPGVSTLRAVAWQRGGRGRSRVGARAFGVSNQDRARRRANRSGGGDPHQQGRVGGRPAEVLDRYARLAAGRRQR